MNESSTSEAAAAAVDGPAKPHGQVISIDEGLIKDHLNKVVVSTVEETLNALLDAEADQLCGAKRRGLKCTSRCRLGEVQLDSKCFSSHLWCFSDDHPEKEPVSWNT